MRLATAETIIDQLGGHKFRLMTGADTFVTLKSGLQFKLPSRFAKNGINRVRIELNTSDLYDLTFYKIQGVDVKEVASVQDVYGDKLQAVFKEHTGLDTSL